MTEARFLQIHTLHSYSSVLLNRDDSGFAKRLPYGGVQRTRISSQCLKRHWRMADDVHALSSLAQFVDSKRSREAVTRTVLEPIKDLCDEKAFVVISEYFQKGVYGKDKGQDADKRQTLLLGLPELNYLSQLARVIAQSYGRNADAAKEFCDTLWTEKRKNKVHWRGISEIYKAVTGSPVSPAISEGVADAVKEFRAAFRSNDQTLRDQTVMPAGLTAALFGRMVTSDPAANIDAPIHVAHAFTTHTAETESDYLTAMDDLKRDGDDGGADTIQEAELTSGLFYGYVVVDIPGLVSNTTGCDRKEWLSIASEQRALAAEVVHNLLYLIAEVSPGAKLGSTAPYGRAELMLVEAGNRQPRSLSAAFREPARPTTRDALVRLEQQLAEFDQAYATGEARRALHLQNSDWAGIPRGSIGDIAQWAKAAVLAGAAT